MITHIQDLNSQLGGIAFTIITDANGASETVSTVVDGETFSTWIHIPANQGGISRHFINIPKRGMYEVILRAETSGTVSAPAVLYFKEPGPK
ncbi:MAG TPA: hypothetical protein VGG72_19595 [Bryobacteraceae bacterium]|jgi:hypothetical protein